MAITDWYNTNEHIQYPFCPYDAVTDGISTNDILDCQFFIINSDYALTGTDSVWLSEKEINDEYVKYTFKCTDTNSDKFKPLVFKFNLSKDWQCGWQGNDDWYGFIAIGKTI